MSEFWCRHGLTYRDILGNAQLSTTDTSALVGWNRVLGVLVVKVVLLLMPMVQQPTIATD